MWQSVCCLSAVVMKVFSCHVHLWYNANYTCYCHQARTGRPVRTKHKQVKTVSELTNHIHQQRWNNFGPIFDQLETSLTISEQTSLVQKAYCEICQISSEINQI